MTSSIEDTRDDETCTYYQKRDAYFAEEQSLKNDDAPKDSF